MLWNKAKFESIRAHINAALNELHELEDGAPYRDDTGEQCVGCGRAMAEVGGSNGPGGVRKLYECEGCGHQSEVEAAPKAPPPAAARRPYEAPKATPSRMCPMCMNFIPLERQCPHCIGPMPTKAVR